MMNVDTLTLLRAADFLNAQLDARLGGSDAPGVDTVEKTAKAISALVKALKDVEAFNQAERDKDESMRYISYEDYPPLRPADRAQIIGKLEALFTRLTADEGAGESAEGL